MAHSSQCQGLCPIHRGFKAADPEGTPMGHSFAFWEGQIDGRISVWATCKVPLVTGN